MAESTSGNSRESLLADFVHWANPLKDAHAALDAAVLAAYGFDAKKDLLSQLLDLNRSVAAREMAGEAVTAPGVPPFYGDKAALITEDCIRP